MTSPRTRILLACALVTSCGGALRPEAAAAPTAPSLRDVAAGELCVSTGRVEPGARLHVDSGAMRAVLDGDHGSVAELAFTYRGPSKQTTPLANGELRRQIGLKLRAKDTCNVVYVMWHVAPLPGLGVSVKYNPGQATHEACRDHGYVTLPTSSAKLPSLEPNEPHVLRAEISCALLRVSVDGAEVWRGALPAEASTFDGPVGVRSDNGAFDFDLRVVGPAAPPAGCTSH